MGAKNDSRRAWAGGAVLLLGLFVGTAVLTNASSSSMTMLPPSRLPSMQRTGPGEYAVWFVHPAWGLLKLLTHRNSEDGLDPGPASLIVTDAKSVVRFSWQHEFLYWFGPAGMRRYSDVHYGVRSPVDGLGCRRPWDPPRRRTRISPLAAMSFPH